jgi:hypothetical protein
MFQKSTYRDHAQVTRLFNGLELEEPGIVAVQKWRPVTDAEASAASAMWGGVGRKA